ncbi:peptidylprolyl isomerase [Sphingomonas sp. C3-2]|uniref:peptidylprolyl isomerase n=1 Tax=Sphingomonas sp. C3-2 TaxID=3062169 RepID=UPI00294ACC1E|nr:peptidylprolyl isomerase [Sphingomonas sp. C3-2]WOK36340.1 peptidylprolyl isomerase [Sphingomonas sp. C3-2]
MRLKIIVPALAGLFLSQAAMAQDAPAETPGHAEQVLATQPSKASATPPVMPIPKPAPDPATDQANILNLDLSTGGRVSIQLRPDVAPLHVERIKSLVAKGFYNGVVFHRVIDGFMAQTGDPTGTGQGGSDLPDLTAEFNLLPHLRGTVSMARTNDPNSANSQFFIMFLPRMSLDKRYTVFGRVISGMQYVDAIERGEPPASPSTIVRAAMADAGAATPVAAPVEPAPADAAPAPKK